MASITRDQLWSGNRLTNHLSRIKHFRGHGIHSPFVYAFVRNVVLHNPALATQVQTSLQERITKIVRNRGVSREIALLAKYCNFDEISIDCNCSRSLIICSLAESDDNIYALAREASQSGTAIVIISPYKRIELCNNILKENSSTSIDRFNYLVLFNNHLPKQHFKL